MEASNTLTLMLLCAGLTAGGFYLAYLYGRRTRAFRWREYVALVSAPIVCCLALYFVYGIEIIYLFVASMFVGFALEYSIGLAYHKVLNKRLWTYDRLSVGGYTSLLSIPMWGIGGVIFFMLAKTVGL